MSNYNCKFQWYLSQLSTLESEARNDSMHLRARLKYDVKEGTGEYNWTRAELLSCEVAAEEIEIARKRLYAKCCNMYYEKPDDRGRNFIQ